MVDNNNNNPNGSNMETPFTRYPKKYRIGIWSTKKPEDEAPPVTNWVRIGGSFMAGATAGAVAKTLIAPLDLTKINFQVSNKKFSTKEALKFMNQRYHEGGVSSLWRGNSAMLARVLSYAGIQFAANEQYKYLLDVDQKPVEEMKPFQRFVAGALAGVTAQTLTYPLDVARTRMAIEKKNNYTSLRQLLINMWKKEGPRSFFRGYTPTMLGIIPYSGSTFAAYGAMKKIYMEHRGAPGEDPNTIESMALGAASGCIGQIVSYPLDVVKRQMQTAKARRAPSTAKTFAKIYKEGGFKRGLFKGISMSWLKGPVAAAITFSTYELTKRFFQKAMTEDPPQVGLMTSHAISFSAYEQLKNLLDEE